MAATTDTIRFREGSGRLCLDFIRTLRHRGTTEAVEELADPLALADWTRQLGPCASCPPPHPALLAPARELREAVHRLIQAARSHQGVASCDPTTLAVVNKAAAQPVPAPALTQGRLAWHADDPVTATLSLVARDALDLAASPAAARIRECAGPHCAALFLDNSRPGTRRWCSMGTCGNHAKKTALRTRAATMPAD